MERMTFYLHLKKTVFIKLWTKLVYPAFTTRCCGSLNCNFDFTLFYWFCIYYSFSPHLIPSHWINEMFPFVNFFSPFMNIITKKSKICRWQ